MNYEEALALTRDRFAHPEYFPAVKNCNSFAVYAVAQRLPHILGKTLPDYLPFSYRGDSVDYLTRHKIEGLTQVVAAFGRFAGRPNMRAILWPINPEIVTNSGRDTHLHHTDAAREFISRTKDVYATSKFPDAIGSYVVSLANRLPIVMVDYTGSADHNTALRETVAAMPEIEAWFVSPRRAERILSEKVC